MKSIVGLVAALLLAASPAMGLVFSEDFNAYGIGSTDWYYNGSSGPWTVPTDGLKLDTYTPDGSLGPRVGGGSTGNEYAHAVLGESADFGTVSVEVAWGHARFRDDGGVVILSDDPATAIQVPLDGTSSLGSPINAIAIGHIGTGSKDYHFFDGQNWTLIGYSGATTAGGWERLEASFDAAGNWSAGVAASSGSGSGGPVLGTLAVAGFNFDTVTAASFERATDGYFGGLDDINITPEPASMVLLGLGTLVLIRRRRCV